MMPNSTKRQSISNRLSTANPRLSTSTGNNGHRLSTSSRNRQSILGSNNKRMSIYGSNSVKGIPETRPLKDKAFQMSCIHFLIEYLTENNYDRKISQQILTSPTGKDFFAICEFLFQRVDPSYSYEKKPEEEVPAMFKALKYPFPLSSRSLVSPGTPHTWPHLLGALQWLIELLLFDERARYREEEGYEDEEESEMGQRVDRGTMMLFDFTAESYRAHILQEQDTEESIEREFTSHIEEYNQRLKKEIEEKTQETTRIRQYVDELSNGPDRLVNLTHDVQVLTKDSEKFELLISKLNQYKEEIEIKQREYQTVMIKEEEEVRQLQQDIYELEQKFNDQVSRDIDVDKVKREKMDMEKFIQVTKAHIEDIERATDQLEREYTQTFNELETCVLHFNQGSRKANITVELGGEMKFNPQGNPILSQDLKYTVKPMLSSLLEKERQVGRNNRSLLFNLSENVERLKDNLTKNRSVNANLMMKHEQYVAKYEELREIREEEMRRFDEEKSRILGELQMMSDEEKRLNTEESNMYRKRQIVEENKCKYKLEQEKLYTNMVDIVDWVAGHKEMIKRNLTDLETYLETQLAD